MNITQQLCCPGAAENQDYIRLGESIAMVVDGSTPLVKDPRVPEVREYVRLLADAVAGAEGEDLPHMVAAGIETLRRRYGVPPETEGVSGGAGDPPGDGGAGGGIRAGGLRRRGTLPGRRGPELVSQEAVSRLDGAWCGRCAVCTGSEVSTSSRYGSCRRCERCCCGTGG